MAGTRMDLSDAVLFARSAIAGYVRPAGVVLDVGPGIRPQGIVPAAVNICAEPHGEYADVLEGIGYPVLRMTGIDAVGAIPVVDTVVALDVIEHMERADGERFIERALHIARQQVVVFTPVGFMPQAVPADGADAWGMHGGHWQAHRSGWKPQDFPGWKIVTLPRFHYGRWAAFYAVWTRA